MVIVWEILEWFFAKWHNVWRKTDFEFSKNKLLHFSIHTYEQDLGIIIDNRMTIVSSQRFPNGNSKYKTLCPIPRAIEVLSFTLHGCVVAL